MRILGISAFYHDSAARLVGDGEIVAAAQEERFTRKKHDARFPDHAVALLPRGRRHRVGDVDHVVFYDKPLLKFERLLETYLAFAPRGLPLVPTAMPLWLREKLFQKRVLRDDLPGSPAATEAQLRVHRAPPSHAASAFFPSPFDEAAILTLDGVGEWATTTSASAAATSSS